MLGFPTKESIEASKENANLSGKQIQYDENFHLSQHVRDKCWVIYYQRYFSEDKNIIQGVSDFQGFFKFEKSYYAEIVENYGGKIHDKWQYTYFKDPDKALYFIENFLDPMTVMGQLTGVTNESY
jgi:hypothetical protein